MKTLKNKLRTLGWVAISTVGAMLLFIVVIGTGNYAQSSDYQLLANLIMTLFPIIMLGYVVWLNRKLNDLSQYAYGLEYNRLLRHILLGLVLPVAIIGAVILAAVLFLVLQISFLPQQ